MYVDYELMLANTKADLEQAKKEYVEFTTNTSLSFDGRTRRTRAREMRDYMWVLKQRINQIEREMNE